MRNLITGAALLALPLLGACTTADGPKAGAVIQTVQSDLATAQRVAQAAVDAYPIVKGMAQIAAIADPALAPKINATIATVDPLVDQARAMLAAGFADAAMLTNLAAVINDQVQGLTIAAAPAVKVVPAGTQSLHASVPAK